MKITVLVDNIASPGLQAEWGLSFFIEYGSRRILLDTGASGLFLDNARALSLEVDKADYAVLSHAHYDHANGMPCFFAVNDTARFYLREGTAENCYKKLGIFKKYIGIPKRVLKKYPGRIAFSSGVEELENGVWLVPHSTPGLAETGKREKMYQKRGGRFVPDDFSHEQSLVFDTPPGLVIFNCCCHGGAANVIRETQEVFPDKRVYAILGGFHIFNKPEAEIKKLAEKIRETGVSLVYTGHCSGKRGYEILRSELGDMVKQIKTGLVIEI